jgi:hypothetical protein
MMTRKDYVKVASIFNQNYSKELDPIINELCNMFKSDNSNFDRQRFMDACTK